MKRVERESGTEASHDRALSPAASWILVAASTALLIVYLFTHRDAIRALFRWIAGG